MTRTSGRRRAAIIAAAGLAIGITAGGPLHAADADAGEILFTNCKACHSIVAPDGTAVQKGGRTGPNLYGIIGRPVASEPGYAYGASIAAVGRSGLVWSEAELADYVADTTGWLKTKLDATRAASKMNFRLAEGGEDVAAYLAGIGAGGN